MRKYIIAIAALSASSFMVEASSFQVVGDQEFRGVEIEHHNISLTMMGREFYTKHTVERPDCPAGDLNYRIYNTEYRYQLGYAFDLSDNWAVVPKVGTEYTVGVRYSTDFGLLVSANLGTTNYIGLGWRF